jgi:hypothetical protein
MENTAREHDDAADRLFDDEYARISDSINLDEDEFEQASDEIDSRMEHLMLLRQKHEERLEAVYKENRQRMQRILKSAIYLPLLFAGILYAIEKSNDKLLYTVFGLNYLLTLRIEITLLAVSCFVWVVRYLQFGIGGIPLPRMLSRAEDEWADSAAAKSLSAVTKMASARVADRSASQVLSSRSQANVLMTEPRERLLAEVNRLGRSNTINLAFGLLSTIAGLWILYATVFGGSTSDVVNLEQFLMGYLPKFTLIVFVEIFAYFFLGLYKKGLADIKYFQNEITNIESKSVALDAALSYKEKDIIADVLNKISSTERNYILGKDQTTVELEIAKSERQSMLKFIKVIPAFAKILSQENGKVVKKSKSEE